jgi:hypothetical protein
MARISTSTGDNLPDSPPPKRQHKKAGAPVSPAVRSNRGTSKGTRQASSTTKKPAAPTKALFTKRARELKEERLAKEKVKAAAQRNQLYKNLGDGDESTEEE